MPSPGRHRPSRSDHPPARTRLCPPDTSTRPALGPGPSPRMTARPARAAGVVRERTHRAGAHPSIATDGTLLSRRGRGRAADGDQPIVDRRRRDACALVRTTACLLQRSPTRAGLIRRPDLSRRGRPEPGHRPRSPVADCPPRDRSARARRWRRMGAHMPRASAPVDRHGRHAPAPARARTFRQRRSTGGDRRGRDAGALTGATPFLPQ
jgi:hypothetical protein